MNIYYRGYLIHQDIRAICYTVYGRRPFRMELSACITPLEAMQWVDRHAVAGESGIASPWTQLALM